MIPDPRGDDHGPGGYVYPDGSAYVRGAFDLTSLKLIRDGDDVRVEAELARPVPVEHVRLASDLTAELFLPTVDIYLDLDREPGSGATEALPGRQVQLPAAAGWEVAIVLSPIPDRVKPLYDGAGAGATVIVPLRVKVAGRKLVAEIPYALVAGFEQAGVAAAVTGTVFATTFKTEVGGQIPTALVREITPQPGRCGRWEEAADGEPCTFGGCGDCELHPRVIDALYPEAGVQERSLGLHDARLARLGLLPVVYPPGKAPPKVEPPPEILAPVVDARGAVLTVTIPHGPRERLKVGQLGDGLDAEGARVATVAVVTLTDTAAVVVKVVDGDAGRVRTVRFTAGP